MPGVCGEEAWRVSLHGGHSSGYCDHAADPLARLLDAAVAGGMAVFGVTEHCPRVEPERLYEEERALGWTVETLDRLFRQYAAELDRIIPEYAGRLEVLKGFEAEVVPEDRYVSLAREWREELGVPGKTGRFLGVVEQAYIARSGPTCEISLVFEVRCPQLSAARPPPSAEDHLEFEWVPLKQLKRSGLLPVALAEHLPAWCAKPATAATRWRGYSRG